MGIRFKLRTRWRGRKNTWNERFFCSLLLGRLHISSAIDCERQKDDAQSPPYQIHAHYYYCLLCSFFGSIEDPSISNWQIFLRSLSYTRSPMPNHGERNALRMQRNVTEPSKSIHVVVNNPTTQWRRRKKIDVIYCVSKRFDYSDRKIWNRRLRAVATKPIRLVMYVCWECEPFSCERRFDRPIWKRTHKWTISFDQVTSQSSELKTSADIDHASVISESSHICWNHVIWCAVNQIVEPSIRNGPPRFSLNTSLVRASVSAVSSIPLAYIPLVTRRPLRREWIDEDAEEEEKKKKRKKKRIIY